MIEAKILTQAILESRRIYIIYSRKKTAYPNDFIIL